MNFWESREKVVILEDQQNVIYSWAESFYNVNFACRVVLNSFSVINQWLEGWNIMGKRLSQDYSLCINKDTVLYSTHNKRKSVRQGRSGRKLTIPTEFLSKRSFAEIVCFRQDRRLTTKPMIFISRYCMSLRGITQYIFEDFWLITWFLTVTQESLNDFLK